MPRENPPFLLVGLKGKMTGEGVGRRDKKWNKRQ
jgi:hypothetical protein